ncbi:MAG: protein translocase subunit SecDF [Saprospiraceae bacterium]|nr:protein translocase subunit SecDF [Saprospiraceae bacterium]
MQGKGIVKFFLVLMIIVTVAQYFFIFPTQKVEKAADQYAMRASDKISDEAQKKAVFKAERVAFLDSVSTEEVFSIPLLKSYTYQELKAQQLALGLDLKGGMSVVLQVDLKNFIKALSNDSKDPTFLDALEKATQAQKNAQSDFVTLFSNAWNEVSNGKSMAPIFTKNEALRDQIKFDTDNSQVITVIRQKANETVDLTFKLLKERIDKLGVTQPNVSLDAGRDLIVVELPGIDNPERARNFLQAAAKLEFWNLYRINDAGVVQAFIDANQRLKQTETGDTVLRREITRIDTVYATDSLGNQDKTSIAKLDTIYGQNTDQGPLFDLLTLNSTGAAGLAVMGTAKKNQRDQISEYLNREDIKRFFPSDLVFRWSKDPIKDQQTREFTEEYELLGLKAERDGKAALTGEHVTQAGASPDPTSNEVAVSLKMDNTGSKIWGTVTTVAAADNNREIAIVLDDEVVSSPRVINPITTGDTQITGNFSIQEATDLSNILQIGRLPAETRIIQESLVGPSLGQENINRSLWAIILGFFAVMAFMVFYYAKGGIVSIIALIANVFFILGTLASIGTVLTLPGIAGIVLTMGMAVDANVIIFERIKEELREGKSLLMSIADGFKHSYSAIIDANVTTLLTAIILAYFGMGPIKGFAVVLIVGVLSSMFTAILVSHLMLDWWTITKGKTINFWTKISENFLAHINVDWMGKRKYGYIFSGLLIVMSLVSFFTRGFELGVDFKGGYSYNVQFDNSKKVEAQQLREALATSFGSAPVVKVIDTENTFNVTTSYLIDDTGEDASERVMAKLFEGVNQIAGGSLDLEQFKQTDATGTHITSSSKVGPTVADDIKNSAFLAIGFSLLAIFIYLAVRFSQWQFSLGAVLALLHDVIITIGLFSMFYGILPFSMEIDQAFIAAILTVIGYSVNDTVIVFDRIREFSNQYAGQPKEEVFNRAINRTLSRTLNTSGTTLITITVLFIFGGGSIKGFAFALLMGILFGTYSSVFIASSIVVDLIAGIKGRKEAVKKAFARATAPKAKS